MHATQSKSADCAAITRKPPSLLLPLAPAPLADWPQMLYTNWPSTGNSFEGAFGGYDDVSVLAFSLAASFHIRVSHRSVQVAVAS